MGNFSACFMHSCTRVHSKVPWLKREWIPERWFLPQAWLSEKHCRWVSKRLPNASATLSSSGTFCPSQWTHCRWTLLTGDDALSCSTTGFWCRKMGSMNSSSISCVKIKVYFLEAQAWDVSWYMSFILWKLGTPFTNLPAKKDYSLVFPSPGVESKL